MKKGEKFTFYSGGKHKEALFLDKINEKISLSTIEIAFKVFLGEKVVFQKTNSNIFKEHKTF